MCFIIIDLLQEKGNNLEIRCPISRAKVSFWNLQLITGGI